MVSQLKVRGLRYIIFSPSIDQFQTDDSVQFLKVFYNVRTKMDITHPPGQEEYAPGPKESK